jgi:hypothetical protein
MESRPNMTDEKRASLPQRRWPRVLIGTVLLWRAVAIAAGVFPLGVDPQLLEEWSSPGLTRAVKLMFERNAGYADRQHDAARDIPSTRTWRGRQCRDKYKLKVPGGLAFSEFRGYESWQTISISQNDKAMALILGNPGMIEAYQAGIPANGKSVSDGAKMAKILWKPKTSNYPGNPSVPAAQYAVQFMIKDSARFADSGGWGYAIFVYDAASDTFRPGTTEDSPPQGNDARCGSACHAVAKSRDYVFTEYAKR